MSSSSLHYNISPEAGRSSRSQTSRSSSFSDRSARRHWGSPTLTSSRDSFVDLARFSQRYRRKENRGCESDRLVISFRRRIGHTDKNPRGSHELRSVDMFLADEVSRVVCNPDNLPLVTNILECECSICIEMRPPNEDRRITVDQIIGDVPETSSIRSVGASSGASSSFPVSTMPMPVIFAILVYLRLPFMIHLDIWSDIHKYPDGLVLDQLLEMTKEPGSCTYFHKLSQLRRPQVGGSAANWRWTIPPEDVEQETVDFYHAFKQAKSQFYPVFISTNMGTLADNAVLPYEGYERMGHGGQGRIYRVEVPQEMDRTYSEINDRSHNEYCCKLISKSRDGDESTTGPAEYELAGLMRMRDLGHPNLIRMITWYDFADTRAFLMPVYQSDLDDYLMGRTAPDFDTPVQGSRRSSWRNSHPRDTYRFPTTHWLWRGIVGVLDGLQKFHGSGNGEGRAAHLDLKPKNILISHDCNLAISDCGLSRVVAESEPLTTQGDEGTAGYRPPETQMDPCMLNEKCDVWSMACIMMEVMLFLIEGKDSVKEFRRERYTRTHVWKHDSFWEWLPDGDTFKLKQVVDSHLDRVQELSQDAIDYALENLIALLRKMFSISPEDRGTIRECLIQLKNEHPMPSQVIPRLELGSIVDSVYINVTLAGKQCELGFYGTEIPRRLRPVSELPLKLMRGSGYNCRIKLFVDSLRRDVSRLTLTTTYDLQGQIVCEVEKVNMREEHLWTQDPGDNGEIEWGFRGLQEGCAFKTDYKSFVQLRQPLILQESLLPNHLTIRKCEVQYSTPLSSSSSIEDAISVEVWRGLGVDRQQSLKSLDSHKPGQRNQGMHRLVIYRNCKNKRNNEISKDCIIVQLLDGRVTFIEPTTGNNEPSQLHLVPNKYGTVKHKEIYYYRIRMGDRHNFPLRPYAVANLEDGRDGNPAISKVKTALAIKLEFATSNDIEALRELFSGNEHLKNYFHVHGRPLGG